MTGSAPRGRVPVSSAGVSYEEIMKREGAHLVDPADKHEHHPEKQDCTEEAEEECARPRARQGCVGGRRRRQNLREGRRGREGAALDQSLQLAGAPVHRRRN